MSHRQTFFLLSAHLGRILVGLVLKAYQMKHSVSENTVKFVFERLAKLHGIVADTVYTDVKLSGKIISAVVQRKGHNIGVEIVVHALLIEVEQILVAAEQVVQLAYSFAV